MKRHKQIIPGKLESGNEKEQSSKGVSETPHRWETGRQTGKQAREEEEERTGNFPPPTVR